MRNELGKTCFFFALMACVMGVWGQASHAIDQTFQLLPGWNAVYLEIEPDPPDCDTQFAGNPVESVWTYENRFSSAQYVQQDTETSESIGWHVWTADHPDFVQTLHTLHAGHGYLVKASAALAWTVSGKPLLRDPRWAPREYSLMGFAVDPASPPTFAAYLAPSAMHNTADAKVFEVRPDGNIVIVNKTTTAIVPGRACWVYTTGFSSYVGPISLPGTGIDGLTYNPGVLEQTLLVKNLRTDARTITVAAVGSLPVQMEYFDPQAGSIQTTATTQPVAAVVSNTPGQWKPLGSCSVTFAGGQTAPYQLRVRVRRPGTIGEYSQTLAVNDGAGGRWLVPVSVGVESHEGLWVGRARMNRVQFGDGQDGEASEIIIPLILHVASTGDVTMLRQVTVMWKNGQRDANGVVTVPGRYVLVTSTGSTTGLSPGYLRDGRGFSHRVTSSVLHADVGLSGTFGSGTIEGNITMAANHPLNPFMHKYHPDHGTGFEFTREFTLEFTPGDPRGPDFDEINGWGDTVVGGMMTEKISLFKSAAMPESPKNRDISVLGTFYLRHVSRIGKLDDSND